jgi:CNT family concentrative nucleoside transporter
LQALIGILFLLSFAWLLSENRRGVPWRTVLIALGLQVGIAVLLIHVGWIRAALLSLNVVVEALDSAAGEGAAFVFGYLGGGEPPFEVTRESALQLFSVRLAAQILLFSVLTALGWYWGILPLVVRAIGGALRRTLGVGGAVGVSTAASIFVGPVEAALTVRPMLASMSRGELFVLLTATMSTVAGTVMVLYASILDPVLPGSLGHILAASVISAPAAILFGLIMVPAEAGTDSGSAVSVHYDSTMDAVTRGTGDGIRLVANVLAMLVVFVALVALVNTVLGVAPEVGGESLTLQRLLGWLFAPVAWLIGIPWAEASTAGSLLGTKLVLNEFIAYLDLAALPADALSGRSVLILAYALCGFANLGSVGIIVGGLLAMVPERRPEILALAPRSLISGTLATLTTGAVVGLVMPAP